MRADWQVHNYETLGSETWTGCRQVTLIFVIGAPSDRNQESIFIYIYIYKNCCMVSIGQKRVCGQKAEVGSSNCFLFYPNGVRFQPESNFRY